MRVCVVGDLHVAPGQDLTRLDWIAAHIETSQPDAVVLMGDQGSWDSVSRHEPLGSVKSRYSPTIADDFEINAEMLERLDGLPENIKLYALMGNHDARLYLYEQSDQRLEGSLWPRLMAMYEAYGWDVTGYGEFLTLGAAKGKLGCNFTHVPFNSMGKPYGNIQAIARDAVADTIYAHTHKRQMVTAPKIQGVVSILNVPCTLPYGHVESYAKLNPTGWSWDITDVTIRDGRLSDYSRVSVRELHERHGR